MCSWAHQLSWALIYYPAISLSTWCFREGLATLSPLHWRLDSPFPSVSAWSRPLGSAQLSCAPQRFGGCGLLLSCFSVSPVLSVCFPRALVKFLVSGWHSFLLQMIIIFLIITLAISYQFWKEDTTTVLSVLDRTVFSISLAYQVLHLITTYGISTI